MSGVATAIGGAALIGGVASYMGSSKASNAMQGASDAAIATQNANFEQTRGDEMPYMQAGDQALSQLNANSGFFNQQFTPDQFHLDPGYQFDLQQGEQALQNSAAASGHLISSQELGNASTYAQNMASNEYQNAYNRFQTDRTNMFNRLYSVANLGQTAASGVSASGMNAANAISNAQIGAGNAQAAGIVGQANAIGGAFGQGVNGYLGYTTMQGLMNRGGSTGDPTANWQPQQLQAPSGQYAPFGSIMSPLEEQ
jgi:hypothetical protein